MARDSPIGKRVRKMNPALNGFALDKSFSRVFSDKKGKSKSKDKKSSKKDKDKPKEKKKKSKAKTKSSTKKSSKKTKKRAGTLVAKENNEFKRSEMAQALTGLKPFQETLMLECIYKRLPVLEDCRMEVDLPIKESTIVNNQKKSVYIIESTSPHEKGLPFSDPLEELMILINRTKTQPKKAVQSQKTRTSETKPKSTRRRSTLSGSAMNDDYEPDNDELFEPKSIRRTKASRRTSRASLSSRRGTWLIGPQELVSDPIGLPDIPALKIKDEVVVSDQLKKCRNLLLDIMKREQSEPFLLPVDVAKVPNYSSIIKEPMDFSTILEQIARGQITTPEEYADKMRLVIKNAVTFNPPGHQVNLSAVFIQSLFEFGFASINKEKTLPGVIDTMTFEEKKKLSLAISVLSEEKLANVIKIVQRRNNQLKREPTGEYVLDLDSLDDNTLRELESYVFGSKAVQKQKQKTTRKAQRDSAEQIREIEAQLKSLDQINGGTIRRSIQRAKKRADSITEERKVKQTSSPTMLPGEKSNSALEPGSNHSESSESEESESEEDNSSDSSEDDRIFVDGFHLAPTPIRVPGADIKLPVAPFFMPQTPRSSTSPHVRTPSMYT